MLRYTGDFDTWIWLDRDNAQNVLGVLDEFGFGGLDIMEEDLSREDSVVQVGYPPRRIDLLTSISGVAFEDAWSRRLEVEIDDAVVGFIGRNDLIANKRAVGRPQNLADVARLVGWFGRRTAPLKRTIGLTHTSHPKQYFVRTIWQGRFRNS